MTEISDAIVYLAVTQKGGHDGLDMSDKGGEIAFASFAEKDTLKKVSGALVLEKRIIEKRDMMAAVNKLNPLEMLLVKRYITITTEPQPR